MQEQATRATTEATRQESDVLLYLPQDDLYGTSHDFQAVQTGKASVRVVYRVKNHFARCLI